MRWTWHDEKNRTNQRDHGLSFETAQLVFNDLLAISRFDPHIDGDRWQTVGWVGTVLLFVVHTSPELDNSNDGNAGRIISARKAKHMKGKRMRKETFKPLPPAQQAELDALAVLPDDQINTAALPERSDWSDAKRGVFFRPIKKQLTLRLDSDLIDWFKSHASAGEGYQTRINSALREYISSAVRHST